MQWFFTNKDKSLDVIALLDSGADVSFIPYGISEILGLDLKDKKEVIGIGGKIQAFDTTLFVQISNPHEKYRFSLTVKVPEKDDTDKFPVLLGRKDFFDHFDITFKEKDRRIVLRKA